MSLKKNSFLIFISFFPVFIFRSNLNSIEVFISLIIFLILPLLLDYFISIKLKPENKYNNLYLASIFTYGIDNHLGLWNGVIQPLRYFLFNFFEIIYIPGVIFFTLLIVIIYLFISINNANFYKVVLIFLCTISIFNIFDQTKSHKKVTNFINENNNSYKKTNLIIIFDEMSGINSFESSGEGGKEFRDLASSFFKKYNFEIYTNAHSIAGNTISSVSSLLNFLDNTKKRTDITKESSNYFFEYAMTKNLFFDKFKDISVYQNVHLNYCNHSAISKCDTHNPFNQKKFLKGYKDTILTKIISIWKLNGSISSVILWRSLRELRVIDSILEPEGHKVTINSFFEKIEKDIYSEKYDLIFAHTLVPHIPYGFSQDCTYDGKLSLLNIYYPINKKVKQHNIERKCVLMFLDKFLINLEMNNKIDSIDLLILSDHGARITKDASSYLSTIYAAKNMNTKYIENNKKISIQKLFYEKFN